MSSFVYVSYYANYIKVFVGRPTIWGIAVCGENGAKRVLEILREELDLTMALSGTKNFHK